MLPLDDRLSERFDFFEAEKYHIQSSEALSKGRVEKAVPFRYSVEPFDVGMDNVSAVSEEYKPRFAFKARIEQVKIELR